MIILFVIAKSLLLALFSTYEKPVDMRVLESMSDGSHSMLPVIIIQEILHTAMRVLVLLIAYAIFWYFGVVTTTTSIILLTSVSFFAIG